MLRIKPYLLISILLFFIGCASEKEKENSFYKKGKSFFINRNLPKAIHYFHKAIEQDKNLYSAYIMLGKAYYYSQKKEQAKKWFHKVLKQDKNHINALNWLARIEGIDEKNYEKGLDYCDRALNIDMENYYGHLYKGIILYNQKQTKQAIHELYKAAQLEEVIYLSHLTLGDIFYDKGLMDKAKIEYNKILQYDISPELKKELIERIKKL